MQNKYQTKYKIDTKQIKHKYKMHHFLYNWSLLQGGSPPARWPANFVFVSAYLILFWFDFDYFDFILIILIIFWLILHFVHGWHMCFDYVVDYLFDLFFGNSWNSQIWPDGCAGSVNTDPLFVQLLILKLFAKSTHGLRRVDLEQQWTHLFLMF